MIVQGYEFTQELKEFFATLLCANAETIIGVVIDQSNRRFAIQQKLQETIIEIEFSGSRILVVA